MSREPEALPAPDGPAPPRVVAADQDRRASEVPPATPATSPDPDLPAARTDRVAGEVPVDNVAGEVAGGRPGEVAGGRPGDPPGGRDSAPDGGASGGGAPTGAARRPEPSAGRDTAARTDPGPGGEPLRIEVTPLPADPPLLNVANLLTLLRLLLVPVFVLLLMTEGGHATGWRLAATVVFAVAALTDRFDGSVARRRGLVTRVGTIADPIADKALMGAALVGLSVLGDLSWWVTVVIAVRELGITALRFWVLRHGVIAASRGGKLKTLVQSVAIGLYLLPLSALGPDSLVGTVRWWLMALAVALTVVTGVDYVVRALRLRARGRAARRVGGTR